MSPGILIDRIALHATRDSSWLLDARLSGLLEDAKDADIAERVRELVMTLGTGSRETWQPLLDRLAQLGATIDS